MRFKYIYIYTIFSFLYPFWDSFERTPKGHQCLGNVGHFALRSGQMTQPLSTLMNDLLANVLLLVPAPAMSRSIPHPTLNYSFKHPEVKFSHERIRQTTDLSIPLPWVLGRLSKSISQSGFRVDRFLLLLYFGFSPQSGFRVERFGSVILASFCLNLVRWAAC